MIKFIFHNPLKVKRFGAGVKVSSEKILYVFRRKEFRTKEIETLSEFVRKYGKEQEDGTVKYVLKDIVETEINDGTTTFTSWLWLDKKNRLHVGDRFAIDEFSNKDIDRFYQIALSEVTEQKK